MSIDFDLDQEGSLSIEESGAVVAQSDGMAVIVKLSTAQMRQFAGMLQRAASFIDKGKTFAHATELEVKRMGGGRG